MVHPSVVFVLLSGFAHFSYSVPMDVMSEQGSNNPWNRLQAIHSLHSEPSVNRPSLPIDSMIESWAESGEQSDEDSGVSSCESDQGEDVVQAIKDFLRDFEKNVRLNPNINEQDALDMADSFGRGVELSDELIHDMAFVALKFQRHRLFIDLLRAERAYRQDEPSNFGYDRLYLHLIESNDFQTFSYLLSHGFPLAEEWIIEAYREALVSQNHLAVSQFNEILRRPSENQLFSGQLHWKISQILQDVVKFGTPRQLQEFMVFNNFIDQDLLFRQWVAMINSPNQEIPDILLDALLQKNDKSLETFLVRMPFVSNWKDALNYPGFTESMFMNAVVYYSSACDKETAQTYATVAGERFGPMVGARAFAMIDIYYSEMCN